MLADTRPVAVLTTAEAGLDPAGLRDACGQVLPGYLLPVLAGFRFSRAGQCGGFPHRGDFGVVYDALPSAKRQSSALSK